MDGITGEGALLATAEVAVAFAGFASVVTVFRQRERDGWTPQDGLRFRLMITASLSTVFFALLPISIRFFGASEPEVWRWASIALAAYLVITLALVARASLALIRLAALNPTISWSFVAGALMALGMQVLNVAGVIFEREIGPYFLGLLYLLVLAGVSFARMLPIGRPFEGE